MRTLERLRVGMMADQGPQLPAPAESGWVPGYLPTAAPLSISPIVGEASAMTLQAPKKNMPPDKRSFLRSHHLALKTRHISALFLVRNSIQSWTTQITQDVCNRVSGLLH